MNLMRRSEAKADSAIRGLTNSSTMEKIAQGAEAIIYVDGGIILKDRFEKKYRHPEIDKRLRQFRTRREYKVLTKLSGSQFPCPKPKEMDDKLMKLEMDLIPGKPLKEVFDDNYVKHATEIGKRVAELHNMGIIHQDLTTSNMILHEKNKEIYFIDFGLSFFSEKEEDKAVDLHLLRRALESKHHLVFDKAYEIVLESYKKYSDTPDLVLERLKQVELRGRNRMKKGS